VGGRGDGGTCVGVDGRVGVWPGTRCGVGNGDPGCVGVTTEGGVAVGWNTGGTGVGVGVGSGVGVSSGGAGRGAVGLAGTGVAGAVVGLASSVGEFVGGEGCPVVAEGNGWMIGFDGVGVGEPPVRMSWCTCCCT
jgi:hypothetical protein